MDVQFYGANCIVFSNREVRVVVDDNLAELGGKSVAKPGDLVLYTGDHGDAPADARMVIDMPGEYEIANLSVVGIPAQAHTDEADAPKRATMYVLTYGDIKYLVTGHIYPKLSEDQLEAVGLVDVMFIPVGGNGYTTDPLGTMQIVRDIEPKLVVPTHYADKALTYPVPQQELDASLKEMAMEAKETLTKLRIKPGELTDVTQLVVLSKS